MHDKLTKLPVTVLLIHGHVDHAMGAAEFDDIYMNRVDDYIFHEHGRGEFRTEAPAVMQNGVHVTEKDLVPTCRVDALRDLREGNILDLGDVRIEVYECPEYTKGSVVFLIQEERMLPLGDACNNSTFLFDSYTPAVKKCCQMKKRLWILPLRGLSLRKLCATMICLYSLLFRVPSRM